MLSAVNILAK